mmetsp:Transcript_55701/g.133299  ORF Transcript_55701/g.133299 Transcript_55701/m.133299 type:complete len:379 (+) Transcript_55701:650-1786(+)
MDDHLQYQGLVRLQGAAGAHQCGPIARLGRIQQEVFVPAEGLRVLQRRPVPTHRPQHEVPAGPQLRGRVREGLPKEGDGGEDQLRVLPQLGAHELQGAALGRQDGALHHPAVRLDLCRGVRQDLPVLPHCSGPHAPTPASGAQRLRLLVGDALLLGRLDATVCHTGSCQLGQVHVRLLPLVLLQRVVRAPQLGLFVCRQVIDHLVLLAEFVGTLVVRGAGDLGVHQEVQAWDPQRGSCEAKLEKSIVVDVHEAAIPARCAAISQVITRKRGHDLTYGVIPVMLQVVAHFGQRASLNLKFQRVVAAMFQQEVADTAGQACSFSRKLKLISFQAFQPHTLSSKFRWARWASSSKCQKPLHFIYLASHAFTQASCPSWPGP